MKDAAGRYVFANETAGGIYGRPAEEIYGKTDAELWPRSIVARSIEQDDRVRESGRELNVSESLAASDGSIIG